MSAEDFDREGRTWFRAVLGPPDLSTLAALTESDGPGRRLDATHPLLAPTGPIMAVIARIRPSARPVRIVAFDKTPEANWALPWHQDRVIAVAERHDLPGFRNWTRKAGIWHCEPPRAVLEEMLFLRLHIDPSNAETGAMRIALGSNRHGPVPADRAAEVAEAHAIETCEAEPGDLLALHMLTLHASEAATRPARRRVLRIDAAAFDLPEPLRWAA